MFRAGIVSLGVLVSVGAAASSVFGAAGSSDLPPSARAASGGSPWSSSEFCSRSTHRYKYRVRIEGHLNYSVTYYPYPEGGGSAGTWGFRQSYVTELDEGTARQYLLRGDCNGRLGIVYFPSPGNILGYLGGTTLRFNYHSDVRPADRPGDPAYNLSPPPVCSYSVSPSILETRIKGVGMMASWTRQYQNFNLLSTLRPNTGVIVKRYIDETHEQMCDNYHYGFRPSTVNDLEDVEVNGIRFSPPKEAGSVSIILSMRRSGLRRLYSPINRLAAGRSFALDSGERSKIENFGQDESHQTTWRVKVRFTRIR